jgi:hypothetical protein
MSAVIENHHDDHHHGPDKGLMRWVLTTNHKDIGTLYLWFSFMMFLVGGCMALVIRAELFQPGLQLVVPEFFNQMTTMHGLIMVFGAVMPAFVGLANWLVPMMIGAPDMALPRMNNYSFWILPFAFGMLLSTLFMEGGAPNFGWTFYAPLSTEYAPPSVTFFIFRCSLDGYFFDYGIDQCDRYHPELEGSRHAPDGHAAVCLDLVDYGLFVDCCYAGPRWCRNHDADGHSLWHSLLQCRWRRRPGPVPARILVFWSP